MKKILGISAYYHDSAAAILVDGHIVAAAQEERFTRKKHTPDFPSHAVRYCLDEAGAEPSDLDAIVFYDKPLLKFERLLETYYAFAPRGLVSFLKSMPVWLREKLFLKKILAEEFSSIGALNRKKTKLLFPEHHLSHAASAFYPSPFEESAVLTIDGVGEWCTASIGYGKGKDITILKEMSFPHSVGLLYSAFTYYLGFTVNSGEYKLMGLAPYGDKDSPQTAGFVSHIRNQLVHINNDGSVWLNPEYFTYATGLRMVPDDRWEKLFGFPRRTEDDAIEAHHCNLALAIQLVTEDIVLAMANEARRATGSSRLCLAGGVALNCVANGKLQREKLFDDIYIQPAAGDAGGALGAALAAHHIYSGAERRVKDSSDSMHGSYLGPSFAEGDIDRLNRKTDSVYQKLPFTELTETVASLLADGNVVGWFRGRMEFGPRALGNRSILGDARNPGMQKKINLSIKYREGFRPFAPAVPEENVSAYFDLDGKSPYMLLTAPVSESHRTALPPDYSSLPMWERLYVTRSDIQAVTHVDYSARIQTVSEAVNPDFHALLRAFGNKTGCPVLVNTSFNVRGEPIVCTPLDAYRCFMSTEMDYLVIENYLYKKTEQPDWQNKDKWRTVFEKD